jgi:hypothetical protein
VEEPLEVIAFEKSGYPGEKQVIEDKTTGRGGFYFSKSLKDAAEIAKFLRLLSDYPFHTIRRYGVLVLG